MYIPYSIKDEASYKKLFLRDFHGQNKYLPVNVDNPYFVHLLIIDIYGNRKNSHGSHCLQKVCAHL